ncbi:MAG: hypothetical protein IPK99_09430 [Flavobacteriales bacterium]|nr:hypothetical protein [Flavobacteriales bacterium]
MPYRVAFFALFLAVFAYVTSAWWNWSYGDSFGQRPYVDVLALVAIPMAFAIDAPRARWRIAWMASAVPLIALNLFQSWQYNANILAPGHLDLSKYGYVFLRTDPARAAALGGKEDHAPYAPNGMFAALDKRCSWTPDSSGTMHWVVPAPPAGEGLWYVHLGITRTELEPGTAQKMEATVSGNGPGWPAGGIHFKVEHLPRSTSPTIRWNNALCVPPRIVGDTIALHLAVPSGCRIDTLFLRVMAPN